MAMRRALSGSVVVALAVCLLAGCGSGKPAIVYSNSPNQPIISYFRSQALPPEFSPNSPVFVVYGDGTVYKRSGAMDYTTGKLSDAQVKALVTSVVDRGFFGMKQLQGQPPPGGAEDHVTVTLKGKSSSVQAPENGGGDLGAIVDELRSYKIPGAREYLPDKIALQAKGAAPGEKIDRVLPWTADPGPLIQAAQPVAGYSPGAFVSGEKAQQIWKLLAGASGGSGTTGWSYGGNTYVHVYAIPSFPMPGV
jgi:hypothetical protein